MRINLVFRVEPNIYLCSVWYPAFKASLAQASKRQRSNQAARDVEVQGGEFFFKPIEAYVQCLPTIKAT